MNTYFAGLIFGTVYEFVTGRPIEIRFSLASPTSLVLEFEMDSNGRNWPLADYQNFSFSEIEWPLYPRKRTFS